MKQALITVAVLLAALYVARRAVHYVQGIKKPGIAFPYQVDQSGGPFQLGIIPDTAPVTKGGIWG